VKIYTSFDAVPLIENAVIALGTFDGMHLAHSHLAEKVCKDATTHNGNSVIVSFLSHPRKTISEDFNHGVLTTQSEKEEILTRIGINNLITIDFSTEIANMSYIDFIQFLKTKIDIQKIVLGYNHHFGKNREGNYDTLLPLGKELHFEVEKIEKQTINGIAVSSSSIRRALNSGDIETANKLLGYNYSICIQALYGKISLAQNKLLPQNGHYAVKIDDRNFVLEIQYPHILIDFKHNGFYKVEFVKGGEK
jgi:riboflavin kinase/FMN adenylyltransferase